MWTHRPLRDHLGSGVGTNKSDLLRPRDSRPETRFLFQHRSFSLSFLASRHQRSSTLHLCLGFGSLSCHIHNTQGNILTDLQEHKYEIVGQQVPALVRHPISPTVCWTNIWRMEQVIKRIAFPSCFVTSLCHFNFSSRLYRLDTGMWISICDTNKRNSLFSELLQFNIIQ